MFKEKKNQVFVVLENGLEVIEVDIYFFFSQIDNNVYLAYFIPFLKLQQKILYFISVKSFNII